jgi:hypothetical protein
VHLLDPVAQRVQHQPVPDGRLGPDRVPAAGHVEVARAIGAVRALGVQVVAVVVQAAQRERRYVQPALGRVVVDDVQEDLDARSVQLLDHGLELRHLPAAVARRRVGAVRGEEAHAVVAPVVDPAACSQRRLGAELVDRQQLDRRDAQPAQLGGDRGVRHAGIGAPQGFRDIGMAHGEPAYVGLVDDRGLPGVARRRVIPPVEALVGHHADPAAAVAGDRARVRVDKQHPRVEAQAAPRHVRSVRPQPVACSDGELGYHPVPHAVGCTAAARHFARCRLDRGRTAGPRSRAERARRRSSPQPSG